MLSKRISRRPVLGLLLGSATAASLPASAWALNDATARALVDSLVAEINSVIASGKSEAAMLKDFERLFVKYADVPIMARYSLGADARSLSPSELSQYTAAFQRYIARKYGRRFREFIGGRIEVQSARPIRAGYEVRTLAFLQGESPFEVTFLVSDKSGSDKFFNIFIEGVNMLLTERTEIGAMLDRRGGNVGQLIADLQATS